MGRISKPQRDVKVVVRNNIDTIDTFWWIKMPKKMSKKPKKFKVWKSKYIEIGD